MKQAADDDTLAFAVICTIMAQDVPLYTSEFSVHIPDVTQVLLKCIQLVYWHDICVAFAGEIGYF